MRTFDEVFAEHTITPAERRELVWHLAAYRARRTVETLLPTTKLDPELYGIRLTPSQRAKSRP